MRYFKLLFLTLICNSFTFAQVGVNATTIDQSAALDIQFGTNPKGLLTPKMTTLQKNGIANPATGLLVFDTDLKSFFYNEGTPTAPAWVRINSGVAGRTNFKRIKSVSDLAAEKIGSTYVLKTDTYYEINGRIAIDFPIDLNNAYLVGLDANEDKLVRSTGTLFSGTSGGTIKNLSLIGNESGQGGTLFGLDGTATQAGLSAQNLLIRDCIVQHFTSIGTIKGFGLVFSSVVQYIGNGGGVTYDTISRLLLSNIGWFGNNSGTFEKYTGTFNLIQKLGGFCDVTAGTFAVDVSSNPVITGDAVLESVVFTGDATGAKYVNRYTVGSYTNFNFNNSWNVRSTGIPNETDANATGNVYFQSSSVVTLNITTPFRIPVTTNAIRLFRTAKGIGANSDRFIYEGAKSRTMTVLGSLSFTATAGSRYIFSIYKNGNKVIGSDVEADVSVTNARQSVSIQGTVDMSKNDYIEIYMQKPAGGSEQILITTYNFIFN